MAQPLKLTLKTGPKCPKWKFHDCKDWNLSVAMRLVSGRVKNHILELLNLKITDVEQENHVL